MQLAWPKHIKKHLVYVKWALLRTPYVLLYYALYWLKAPLHVQIKFLPTPLAPPIYWTSIEKIQLHGSLEYPPAGRLCMEGDWDIRLVHPLPSIYEAIPTEAKKWDLHQTVRSMFLFGEHYSTTPQYKQMMQKVENKNRSSPPPQGCRTPKEVDQYFQRLQAAFNSMQSHGYLTQEELGRASVGEVRLHLTREGKLCLGTGGNHRVRMAEILGIQWIPFLLRGVHPQWIIQLSNQSALPPHKALARWMNYNFYSTKPTIVAESTC